MKTKSTIKPDRIDFQSRYLPRRLQDLVGFDVPVQLASRWLSSESFPKAILISGGMGNGKTMFAHLLAKAAACQDRPKGSIEPCGACRTCTNVAIFSSMKRVGSEVSTESFIRDIRSIRSGSSRNLWDDNGRWLPIVVDEIHELTKDTQRRLRAEIDQAWLNSFLVGTTHHPEKLDAALRDRFYPVHLTPPPESIMVKWAGKMCSESGIQVESEKALEVLIYDCGGRFRAILIRLQEFHDLNLPLTVASARKLQVAS